LPAQSGDGTPSGLTPHSKGFAVSRRQEQTGEKYYVARECAAIAAYYLTVR